MATFDDILNEAGKCGRCQKRIFALICFLSVPFGWVFTGIVFQGFTPDHWCLDRVVAAQREACGWSLDDGRRLTVPLINTSGELLHSSCEQYDVDWNTTGLTCDTQELDLRGVPLVQCKDGWEYLYGNRKSFVTEFDLVCSNGWLVDIFQSTLNLGFLFGSIVFGYLADRFGRNPSLLLSNILNAISGILMAVVPNYISVLVFRTILGLGVKGGWMIGYVLLTEIVGTEYRRTMGILFQMFFTIGILFLPLFAYFLTDWRWLQLVFGAPYFLFIIYYWFIPESPRWLISQNKHAKALEISERIAQENKCKLSVKIESLTDNTGDCPTVSFLDLVRTPTIRKCTFILMFSWFTCAVVYQGLIMRVGIAGGNVYLSFLIGALVELPATFLIIFTIERVGRRIPFAISNFVAGVFCFITVFVPDSMYWFKTVVASIGRLGITVAFEMVVFVNMELYPTFMRNMAVSTCSTLSDIGGMVSPFLLFRLAAIWIELPLIVFGALALMAGVLVLLLPETQGLPLPDTIEDVEFINRKKEDPKTNHHLKEHLKCDDANETTV